MTAHDAEALSILRHLDDGAFRRGLEADVRAGFARRPRTLPPKYFYDERGSALFDEITRLPEYDLTRNETALLERAAPEALELVAPVELVELGAGASRKVRLLIEALLANGGSRYAPLDVDEASLRAAGAALVADHPELIVEGHVGDYVEHLVEIERTGRRLIAFLGSTYGNLEPEARAPFLRAVRAALEPGDGFLLGVDLLRAPALHQAAYDDAAGVTARFDRNVLTVLNRELGGDIPVDAFEHVATWDAERECVVSCLRSLRAFVGRLAQLDLSVEFEQGEELFTEISCKFRPASVDAELAAAGLEPVRWWVDEPPCFGLVLAVYSEA